jgi:hypothetical protein
MIKQEKEILERTLAGITNLCGRLMEVQDDDTRIQILTNCQEAGIALGEKLEACTNPLDVRAISEYRIINKTEDFCEQVYVCSQDFCTQNIELLKSLTEEIAGLFTHIPRTYRVVFLPYKASMWDSLESIWKCFAADERCETSVVPIPYFEANRETNEWETRYEGNLYPKDVPVVFFQEYLLGDKKPDLAFIHNPFDQHNYVTTVHPAYYSQELKKHCGKLVYVPYYVNPGFLSRDYNELPSLYRADYIVLQSERMKETCKNFPYYDRVLPLGSPKFDKVIRLNNEKIAPPEEWNIDMAGKKKLLLNTTISDFLESGEKLMAKLHRFFEKAASMEKVVIIWRPHPLLEGTVKAMRPQFIKQYQDLVDFFNDNKVGVFDRTADVSRAVAATDAYIGSYYSSMIGLYEVCNKPVFCFDSQKIYEPEKEPQRKRANAEDVFKMNGEFDFFDVHECMEYTFDDFVDDLVGEQLGKVLENQRIAEAGISNNLDGTCGIKVHEYIMQDLMKNG